MNRLKELRQSVGLSQAELAKVTDTTQRNISYWESGKIELNLYAAIRLAQVFQVDVEYLAGYADELGTKPDINLPYNSFNGAAYSSEERKLIEDYRELNTASKKLINETIKTLLATSAGSEQKKKDN